MNSDAPGQLLGYALQIPRALFHLLRSSPGEVVCVEALGDVSKFTDDQPILSEEDKSSVSKNPVSDRSENLWKTFFNWITLVKSGDLDTENAKFILYCNYKGQIGLVNKFSDARNKNEVTAAIKLAEEKLNDINQDHSIWKFYSFCISEKTIFAEILGNFEFDLGSTTGSVEVQEAIKTKLVPDAHIEFLEENLHGWLSKKIMSQIHSNQRAAISHEEFSKQFILLFQRLRARELVDFAAEAQTINNLEHLNSDSPIFLHQLDAIDASDEQLIAAVNDQMKAEINRDEWIRSEIIDETTAKDFENKLKRYWENTSSQIELAYSEKPDKKRGQLVLLKCSSRQETIGDASPPDSTVSGTYHALANEPCLGWHPKWKNLLSEEKE